MKFLNDISGVNATLTGTLTVGTISLTNALTQAKTHASPDTDSAPTALHHTLGTGANQAAAGNHTHDAATGLSSGVVAIARGGTNSSASPTAGAVPYGTGSAYAFTNAGTSGQFLKSGGSGAPSWAALATSDVTGLDTALAGKASTTNTVTTDTTQTITGWKTFSGTNIPQLGLDANPQQLTSWNITGQNLRVWHDRVKFSAPTYEVSADGSAWSPGVNGSNVFTGRSDQGVSIDHTARFVRWTWNDSGLNYSQIQRALFKFGYVTPNPSVNVNIWSSTDGSVWTSRLSTSLSGASAQQWVVPFTDPGASPYIRLQLEVVGGGTSGQVCRPVSIELQTPRFGDQGSAPERELPYYWDSTRSVRFFNHTLPYYDFAHDLGGASNRWRDVYVGGTVHAATLNPTNALAQSKTHASADTDTAPTAIHHTLGTGANQAAAGNDPRFTDARTPLAHTHAASDITSGVLATARLGTGTADTTTYLRGDGTWQPVAGGETNTHVGPDAPVGMVGPYLWVQTGLGPDGDDFTFWIEDGQ